MMSSVRCIGGVEALACLGGAAFIFAMLAQAMHLPPLLGFIGAGFVLNFFGVCFSAEALEMLSILSELGVLLLLFNVGLKLDLGTICRREVLCSTLFETFSMGLLGLGALALMRWVGIEVVQHLDFNQSLLIAVTLSFSSTILAMKVLQERGEIDANYGRLALSILVAQDLIAVVFLALSGGQAPKWSACLLLFLPLLRPPLYRLIDKLGHNEMFVLGGVVLTLVPGVLLFHQMGLEAELGALVCGMLLAGHARASELSKALFGLKELCLVGYFLQLGLTNLPTPLQCGIAIAFLLLLPLKALMFYLPLKWFRFRSRTVLSVTATLSNFSEFGIIVMKHASAAAEGSVLDPGWSTIFALATALSFPAAKPLDALMHLLLPKLGSDGSREHNELLHPDDQLIDFGQAKILILGMGRVGRGAYDEFRERYGEVLLGVELYRKTVNRHAYAGRQVITADATDPDFWARIMPDHNIQLVLLAMSHAQANQSALQHLQAHHYRGRSAAIVEYEDEEAQMREAGVDAAFNIYSEAGSGFAAHLVETLHLDRCMQAPPLESQQRQEQRPQ